MDFTALTSSADLATQLEAGGGRLDQTSRELLEVLVDDLRNAANLDRWAEIDLVGILARPENFEAGEAAAPGRSRPRWLPSGAGWERNLEAVLGFFVFVPLLITWFGLFSAARAYGELAATDKQQATRPFLQLWESGFDGRLSNWLRFGDIAGFAVLFILTLLLLALLHSASRYWTQRAEDRRRAEADQAGSRLAALLTRAQLHLVGYRLTSPAQFTTALSQSAEMLRDLINDARLAQDSVTTVLAEAERISSSLDHAADKMNGATDVIGEAATRVSDILRESTDALTDILATGTTALADTQRTGVGELTKVVGEGVRSLKDAQQTALDAMEASAQAGVEALEAARRTTQEAVDAATRATQDAARQNAEALRGVQERLGHAGDQVEVAVRDLTGVQRQLSERSDRVAQAAEQMADSMVATAQQTSDSARQIVDQANVSLGELTNIVERWDQAAAHWVLASRAVEQRLGPLAEGSLDGQSNGHDGAAAARGGRR